MASEVETGKPPGNLIIAAIPTKNGVFSHGFSMSLLSLQTTINVSLGWQIVVGKPVDEARNLLVDMAKQAGAKYILFIDDDTILPPFALARLLNMGAKVASGMYYTKSQPPTPVILKKDIPGGYKDWQYGDVIEVDYIGLGCALIDMSVFDEIEPPYFKFIKGSADPNTDMAHIGEDVYFCQKVAAAGHKIYVDTVIQCQHEDFPRKTVYFYHHPTRTGAWRGPDGKILYIPPAVHEGRVDVTAAAKENKRVCWGWGASPPAGFEEANEVDIDKLREKYKNISAAKVRNVFEFATTEQAEALLSTIYRLMKPEATIEIAVPNIVAAINKIDDKSDINVINAIYGYPDGKYRSAYTKAHLDELATLAGFKRVSVREDGDNLVLEGVKE